MCYGWPHLHDFFKCAFQATILLSECSFIEYESSEKVPFEGMERSPIGLQQRCTMIGIPMAILMVACCLATRHRS